MDAGNLGINSMSERAVRKFIGYDFFRDRSVLHDYSFGVIYLRMKQPELERPYKTWLYPVTPVIYLVIGTCFCILLLFYKQQYTWLGFVLVLLGLPVYYFINRKRWIINIKK